MEVPERGRPETMTTGFPYFSRRPKFRNIDAIVRAPKGGAETVRIGLTEGDVLIVPIGKIGARFCSIG